MTLAVASALASAAPPSASKDDAGLHVASPDWRDQIIYFLMIDRFADGDSSNNDQGGNEFDPEDRRRYSGGDLVGITQQLDYIQGLGATAVWITPPVAHQWWDGDVGYGGYHGYWAENFKAVDAHFGNLADYQQLSRALHGRGMYLVQDIVLNHTGNFFTYDGEWDAKRPNHNYRRNRSSTPVRAPSQWPFSLNNPRRREDLEAAIYHWTPNIVDYSQLEQERNFQLANLDDLNTESPLVRKALRDSYGHWIREVGVDAFRLDTAYYVPPEMLGDFLDSDDAEAPGVMRVAKATGRQAFHVFGEGFGMDRPGEEVQMRKIERYATEPDGRPLLPGMINFPLYGSLNEVFARGRPTSELADRIRRVMTVHRDPHRMPTFVDNHDVDRFLAAGSESGLRQALLLLMTLPGIPTIYYGTEQGFTQPRQAMFAAGFGAGDRDHFDARSALYAYLAKVTRLRRAHPALSRGVPTILRDSAAGPGALVYRMDASGEASLLVMFNSAEAPILLDNVDAGLLPGQALRRLFSIHETTVNGLVLNSASLPLAADARGKLTLELPARSGLVWALDDPARVVATQAAASSSPATIRVQRSADGRLQVNGEASPGAQLKLVVDGQLATATAVSADAAGTYSAAIDINSLLDSSVEHHLVAWSPASGAASEAVAFRAAPRWTLQAEVSDPSGDDAGPRGRYRYPSDPSWGEHRQMDLRGARAFVAGASMRLELDMHRVTQIWNPANDFDHVAFSIFISLPGATNGVAALPLQNAKMPANLRWHYRLRAHGWSNAMFTAVGASETADGKTHSPGAQIAVDKDRHRVSFLIPASALGNATSLAGASIYVTTWDYDSGYRRLSKQGDGHSMAGGDGANDPLVMDDLLVRLPEALDTASDAAVRSPTADK
ncbi:MAG: alpha-amylase family glycosyl hydrolase [Pseudomarimonas sp.]